MRVKCLAQGHNAVPRPGLEPGPLKPESSELIIWPPRLPLNRASHNFVQLGPTNCFTRVLLRRRTENNSRSRASTDCDSEGSVEGQYNFAAQDDEIDMGMFAGDRNSSSSLQDPKLRYLDPARLNHDIPSSSEYNVDDVIRLENYKPRGSPIASRINGATFYADIDVINDSHRTEDSNKGSAGVTNSGLSLEDFLDSDKPPNWAPPPPPVNKNESPVHSQDNKRTSPDKLTGDSGNTTESGPLADGPSSSEDSSEDEDITPRLTVKQMEPPQYSQIDPEKGPLEPQKDGSSFHSEDTSEDDDAIDWPPPPPPPQRSSYQPDDSDWERPLPPEILALPGKRNRVASWARDETEDAPDLDDLTKI